MSLDNSQLPPFLIGQLYKNSIVDLESVPLTPKSLKSQGLIFLGKNEKQVVIVVNTEHAVHLPDDDLNFLTGVLTACKLTLSDCAVVNCNSNTGLSYKMIIEQFKPATLICLGIKLSALAFPLEFPNYQVQKYNGQSYLSAPSLGILAADKLEKQQLWTCLKKIFSI